MILALLLAAELHRAPTGVVVHREQEQVRVVRGDEEVLAQGDYVEVVAFGRLWVVDGDHVTERPPALAQRESVLISQALTYATEQGCPVGVQHLSTQADTGAYVVTLGRDREQTCSLTIGAYTGQIVNWRGPDPEPATLTLAVGERRTWRDLRFHLQAWDTAMGLVQIHLVIESQGDQVALGAPVFEEDPLFYMEGEAFSHLVRVTGIPGGVRVALETLPERLKLRMDQLDHVPDEARRLGCTLHSEAFLYDERRGSAVLTFRDAKGNATCKAVVGLVSGEVVGAFPQ